MKQTDRQTHKRPSSQYISLGYAKCGEFTVLYQCAQVRGLLVGDGVQLPRQLEQVHRSSQRTISSLGRGRRRTRVEPGTRDPRISIRGQNVAKKFTDEENRTARKSHCEKIALRENRTANVLSLKRLKATF